MKSFSRWLAPRTQGAIVALVLVAAVAYAGVTNYDSLQLDPLTTDTNALLINDTSGTAQVTVTKAGVVTLAGSTTYTMGAGESVLVDGSTTAHTDTAGVLDVNSATVTANVSALDLLQTTNNGTVAATDTFIANLTMTQNDADADAFGVKITASATANAAAGSYEYGLTYDCAENTAGACLDGILLTSSGVDAGMTDGLDVSAANITNGVNIGSNLILGGNSDSINIGATDNTFTVTADAANTAVIQGADAAGAANTAFDTTGAGAITIGSGDVTAITLTTDGTGTGEVVLPGQSVEAAEIVNDTVDGAQLADTIVADTALVFQALDNTANSFVLENATGGADFIAATTTDAAETLTLGSASLTALTVTTDGTGTAEVVLPASSIAAGEIVDIARNIDFELGSFIDCQTDAGAYLGFSSGANTIPDFVNSATDGTGFVIRFDDTGGQEDQGSEVCSQFTVPPDYVSGGAFIVRALKDAHAGATEVINCAVSVNGAALQAAGTVTTSASASTTYTCTPTIAALAAADSVSFYLSITSGTTMDDTVDLAAVSFQYTATQ